MNKDLESFHTRNQDRIISPPIAVGVTTAVQREVKVKTKDVLLAQLLGETPTMISKPANIRSNGGSRVKKKVLTTVVDKKAKRDGKTKKNKKVRIEEPISDVESSDVEVDESE